MITKQMQPDSLIVHKAGSELELFACAKAIAGREIVSPLRKSIDKVVERP